MTDNSSVEHTTPKISDITVDTNPIPTEVHGEGFDRLTQRSPNDRVRIIIQREDMRASLLLAVVSRGRPMVRYESLQCILTRYGAEHVTYHNVLVTS